MTLPDSDTISTYGGALSNYGVDVVDPTTDRDASSANKAYASTAMMTRTATRGHFSFVGAGSAPSAPTSYEFVWKGQTTTAPTMGRTGTGVFTATLPTSVLDELGVSHSVNVTRAWGQARGSTAYHVQCDVAVNVITIRVWALSSFAASDATGVTIDIFVC